MEINATIIVQLAVFLTLAVWLSKVLFNPLLALFDERERRIYDAKEEAKALEESGLHKLAFLENRTREAQRDSRDILTGLKAEGALYQRRLVDEAKSEAKQRLSTAKMRIDQELDRARSQMGSYVAEDAVLLVNRFASGAPRDSQKSGNTKMEFRSA